MERKFVPAKEAYSLFVLTSGATGMSTVDMLGLRMADETIIHLHDHSGQPTDRSSQIFVTKQVAA